MSLGELIKCCTAVVPSILTVMTLVRAYLRMITLLAVKQEQRNTVDLFEKWCTAVSAVAIRTLQCDRYLVSRLTWTESKVA